MKDSRIIRSLSLLLVLFLAACSPRRGTVELVFVQTADIHGEIYADNPMDGSERKGSLLKVASYIKGVRKENRNVIYLDAGDNLQGSVEIYHNVVTNLDNPELASTVLSAMGCDASVPGNHDIAVGPLPYDRFVKGASFPVLAGNVGYESYGDYLAPYTVIDKHGVRIAVIGLITKATELSVPSDIYGELGFADMVESARYWMDVVREKENPDMVVGLFHSGLKGGRFAEAGIEEDAVLSVAENVPGFDIIFYGHDHTANFDSARNSEGGTVLLVNPGAHCEKVGVVKAALQFEKGQIIDRTYSASLVDVTDQKPDAELVKKLADNRAELDSYLDSSIGTLADDMNLDGMPESGASEINYIHGILARHFAAQITLCTPPNEGESFRAGDFTVRDAFRLYPYENNMVSLMMSGNEIRNILEYSAQAAIDMENGTPGYLSWDLYSASGIVYEVDCKAKPGQRVHISSMMDGTAFNPDAMYRVTMNSFMYGGGDSTLPKASGLSRKQLAARLNLTSKADIRYFILTDFAVRKEAGLSVEVPKNTNFKYVGLR